MAARIPPPTAAHQPTLGQAPAAASLARTVRNAVLVALLLLFVWLTIKVDLVIFAGIVLALCLRGAAERLNRVTGAGVGWMLALVVVLIMLLFALIGWFFSQSIAGQINQLSQQLPQAAGKLAASFKHSGIGQALSQHIGTKTTASGLMHSFFGFASNAAEVIGAIIVIIFLGIYFAAETELYTGGLLRLVPPSLRPRASRVLVETASAVRYWILGRLAAMISLGILAALGLWVLGVPLPGALGFLAGIMIFVPYIGSVVSAIPAVLLAAATSLSLALYVIVLYIGIHLIEGYVLVPLVQRRVVHLPPALTLSSQLILGVLAGFIGLLFATPLVAVAIVLVRMIYVEGILGDHPSHAISPAGHAAGPRRS